MSLKLYQGYFNLERTKENMYYDEQGNTVYKVHTPFGFATRTTTITKAIQDQPSDPEISSPLLSPSGRLQNAIPTPVAETDPGYRGSDADDSVSSVHSGSQQAGDAGLHEVEPDDESNPGGEMDSASSVAPRPRNTTQRTNFMYIAQIDWRAFRSAKLRFASGRYSGQEVQVKNFFRKKGWSKGSRGRHRLFTGEDGKEYRWRLAQFHSELTLNDETKTPIAIFHPKKRFKKKSVAYLEVFPEGQHILDEIIVTFTYIESIRKARE